MLDDAHLERFMAKVQPEPMSGCWLWLASYRHLDYGQFAVNRKSQLAHRVSYEHFVGPIPAGTELDHKCRTPSCVNPEHLEPVTHAENVRRGESGRNNSRKTRCIHGHEYTPENTEIQTSGHRACRICRRDIARESARRQRARKRASEANRRQEA